MTFRDSDKKTTHKKDGDMQRGTPVNNGPMEEHIRSPQPPHVSQFTPKTAPPGTFTSKDLRVHLRDRPFYTSSGLAAWVDTAIGNLPAVA